MPKIPHFTSTFFSFYISFFMIFWCKPVLALPQGGSVVAGAATISNPSANLLQINQDTQRAIINWNSFSIANGQTTQFIQPGTASAVLNRVTGGNPSDIYGQLKANGAVYLINQNGITIGPSGIIDVNTFVASTLNVNNSEFMGGGDLIFKGKSTAEVKNMGTINAMEGDVFLIGRKVSNSGSINAPSGTVGLAAGDPAEGEDELEVLLKSSGDQRIFIRVRKAKESEEEEESSSDEESASTTTTDADTGSETSEDELTAKDLTTEETSPNETSETIELTETEPEEVIETDSESGPIEVIEIEENSDNESSVIVAQTLDIDGVAFEVEYEYVWEALDTVSNVGQIVSDSVEGELSEESSSVTTATTEIASSSAIEEASILNTGVIKAVQAELRAVGGNQYALAINNTGEIRATGVNVDESGNVSLVAKTGDIKNSGTIAAQNANGDGGSVLAQAERGTATNSGTIDVAATAPGGTGGEVQFLGQQVNVVGDALIDASGDSGGGEVLVGGDKLGLNPEIQNAINTVFENTARINADANIAGDGGKVIVYADGSTQFDGMVTARGGVQAGNGGLIESSGKQHISFDLENSVPDASARAEGFEAGEWLIDPFDLVIYGSTGDTISGSTYNASANPSYLDVAAIKTALIGTSVNLVATGNITWNSGISLDFDTIGSKSLSLDAGNDILYSGKIWDSDLTNSDSLNVNFNAANNITIDGFNTGSIGVINTSGGAVNLQAGGAILIKGDGANKGRIATGGGNINISANGTRTGDYKGIELNASSLNSGAGDISLNGKGGNGSVGNYGVFIHSASTIQSVLGSINISGQGGTNSAGTYLYGVKIDGSGTQVSSSASSVNISGTGGSSSTGGNNVGLYLGTSATVSTNGTHIHLIGNGGQGSTGGNHGVFIEGSAKATTQNGSIFVGSNAGQPYTTTGTASYATLLDGGGAIQSTGTAGITFLAAYNGMDEAIKIGNTSYVGNLANPTPNSGNIRFFLDTDILDFSGNPIADVTASSQIKTLGTISKQAYADFNPPQPRDGGGGEILPPPPPEEELAPPPDETITIDPTTGETLIRFDDGTQLEGNELDPNRLTGPITSEPIFEPAPLESTSLEPTPLEPINSEPVGDFGEPIAPDGEPTLSPDSEPLDGSIDGPLEGDSTMEPTLRDEEGTMDSNLESGPEDTLLDERPEGETLDGEPRPEGGFDSEGEPLNDGDDSFGPDGEPNPDGENRLGPDPDGEGGTFSEDENGPEGERSGDEEGGPRERREGPEGEEDRPVDESGAEPESEEGESPAERDGPDGLEPRGPRNGTDTSFDDQVMLPGETLSFGGPNVGPPPPTLDLATAPVVRTDLGSTNQVAANTPPPPATPVPPPVPPAPPALDALRVNPGQTMNLGGSPIPPPPQVQVKLDVSVSPGIANSLRGAAGL